MPWYIAKKQTDTRWTAYEFSRKPTLKRGYEMRGPYASLVKEFMAANAEVAAYEKNHNRHI